MQLIGQTIAHDRVIEKLGEGGMGVVYKGGDNHLDRFVALKILPAHATTNPDRKRRFIQEAEAASALTIRTLSRFTTSITPTAWTSSQWTTCAARHSNR
jgi:serine/threonine protein kinase